LILILLFFWGGGGVSGRLLSPFVRHQIPHEETILRSWPEEKTDKYFQELEHENVTTWQHGNKATESRPRQGAQAGVGTGEWEQNTCRERRDTRERERERVRQTERDRERDSATISPAKHIYK